MRTEVRISDGALESMVSAACESYEFGNNNGERPVETYAHVWGYRRLSDDGKIEYILIDRVNACVSAKGSYGSVTLNVNVVDLQDRIVRYWSPHLCLLGDFHTHPFKSFRKLKKRKGWRFSEQDQESFLRDKNLWKRATNAPITLVMAMAPTVRRRVKAIKRETRTRWRFQFERYRFYLTVAKGTKRSGKKRAVGTNGIELQLDRRSGNR